MLLVRRLAHATTRRPSLLGHARSLLPVIFDRSISLRRWLTSGPPQSTDILELYRALIVCGRLKQDDDQVRVLAQLRKLGRELDGYVPPVIPERYLVRRNAPAPHDGGDADIGWWADCEDVDADDHQRALVRVKTHAEELADLTTPKGLLITGPPGSGKTFLVNLWLGAQSTAFKARKHYAQFVLEVYRAVWLETQRRMADASLSTSLSSANAGRVPWTRSVREHWRALARSGAASVSRSWARGPSAGTDGTYYGAGAEPIALVVARRLVLRHWLLALDELQLLDVSSATLLADVLSYFWRLGGVLVATSNRVPEDLYRNGVQRERLGAFVSALEARCPVVEMVGKTDWRVTKAEETIAGEGTWFVRGQERAFENVLVQMTTASNSNPVPMTLQVFGRTLSVPWTSSGTCKFAFKELCEDSLGPADYLTIASSFSTVAITDVPVLRMSEKNQARRFISLIDALYEARCRLLCLAEVPPEELFFPEAKAQPREFVDMMMAESVAETQDVYRPNVAAYDAPRMEEAPTAPASALALEELSIFSGKDEQFAYKRALSRLKEMMSARYAAEELWTPLPSDERKWERSVPSLAPRASIRSPSAREEEQGDFAAEAAYPRASTPRAGRPESPRIRPYHVWGVGDHSDGRR